MNKTRSILISLLVAVMLLAMLVVPQLLEIHTVNKFAEPLYAHEVRDGDLVLHSGVQYQLDNVNKVAVLLLRTDKTVEETKAFYDDLQDMEEKDLIVQVTPAAAEDPVYDVIKEKGYYDADLNYYWVYMYSDDYAGLLFLHDLPQGDRILTQDVTYIEDNRYKVAYIHLETEMTAEETEELFSDVLETGAAKRDGLVLEVTPLDADTLKAYENEGKISDGKYYYTVSLTTT